MEHARAADAVLHRIQKVVEGLPLVLAVKEGLHQDRRVVVAATMAKSRGSWKARRELSGSQSATDPSCPFIKPEQTISASRSRAPTRRRLVIGVRGGSRTVATTVIGLRIDRSGQMFSLAGTHSRK
jgi:hypothetical protein